MQRMCPLQQTEPGTVGVSAHRHLQQCGLARFTGPGLYWERWTMSICWVMLWFTGKDNKRANSFFYISSFSSFHITCFVSPAVSQPCFWTDCVIGADLSAGVLATFITSLRQAMSSSLVQLHGFKETTLHWFMGGRSDDYEERGTVKVWNFDCF